MPCPTNASAVPIGRQSSNQERGRAFKAQKRHFRLDAAAAGISAQVGRREDTVAGNENRDRVGSAGLADGLRRHIQIGGEIAIGPGLAIGDRQKCGVKRLLKGRAARAEGTVNAVSSPAK